ncbi:MAG: nitroreductase family protein [Thermoprotei archaeon]|nr:nitroreductase family protein [Thermoprotei archaeon]
MLSRRSIRSYERKKIPENDLRKIMEAALMAPTDGSLLLWSAIRIKNEELRRNIAEVVGQRSIRFLHISG